jgi:soluble P-type ATPase
MLSSYHPIQRGVKVGLSPSLCCIISPMIELDIPGRGSLQLRHLVMDVNGTLAVDGTLLDGLAKRLSVLRERLEVHLVTADTHGRQAEIDRQLNLQAVRIGSFDGIRTAPGTESAQKAEYVRHLGAESVVAIGQGANDAGMLEAAALGICVLSPEGTAVESLLAADLVAADIFTALDLLDKPLRIVASLRK